MTRLSSIESQPKKVVVVFVIAVAVAVVFVVVLLVKKPNLLLFSLFSYVVFVVDPEAEL